MKPLSFVIAAAIIVLTLVPVRAHHSFGGTYDVSKTVTVKGKMVQVTLRPGAGLASSPHFDGARERN